jgi:hypothetical protein
VIDNFVSMIGERRREQSLSIVFRQTAASHDDRTHTHRQITQSLPTMRNAQSSAATAACRRGTPALRALVPQAPVSVEPFRRSSSAGGGR